MGVLDTAEIEQAQWEAAKGAGYGALKWGAFSAACGGLGYAFSPMYRGFTIQFKVYIQMSGMILGSMIEADARMRRYEQQVRIQRRINRDRAEWERFTREFGEDDDLLPPSLAKHRAPPDESSTKK
ncbi:uncharacterized protein B0I36DRAFT_109789 [Microdochium trichocladiopsis]|uniref:Imidazoleglycerol-phosphate dehydratase n=1 Tax=Microdochium trichocladiopsis TaxID=1682393 RepID=A0A9P8YBX5_9PEZI|nr:uncharacterized protein B0I36DRAFT_109789 [Microdochium trichocladiopsis]KAH7033494.1 hypothetical protein B0I36DRAFT_109789 [Microdochium trichocladiopsis]